MFMQIYIFIDHELKMNIYFTKVDDKCVEFNFCYKNFFPVRRIRIIILDF